MCVCVRGGLCGAVLYTYMFACPCDVRIRYFFCLPPLVSMLSFLFICYRHTQTLSVHFILATISHSHIHNSDSHTAKLTNKHQNPTNISSTNSMTHLLFYRVYSCMGYAVQLLIISLWRLRKAGHRNFTSSHTQHTHTHEF